MTTPYDRMANTVLKQLTKYGRPVVLRQYSASGGDYDPRFGGATPVGEDGANDSIRQALVADQPGSQIGQRFGSTLDGQTLVQQGEKWLYLDAKGAAPSLEDKIIFDNVTYQLIDVQVCQPGLIPVFYLLVLRR